MLRTGHFIELIDMRYAMLLSSKAVTLALILTSIKWQMLLREVSTGTSLPMLQ